MPNMVIHVGLVFIGCITTQLVITEERHLIHDTSICLSSRRQGIRTLDRVNTVLIPYWRDQFVIVLNLLISSREF